MSEPKDPAESADVAKNGDPIDTRLVRKLAAIFKDTDLTEIEVERDGLRIRLARGAAGLERWHSITGTSAAFTASSRAMEVWVRPPGLITTAEASVRASCSQSISTPSWLDCRNSRSKPTFAARATHIASTSFKVVEP